MEVERRPACYRVAADKAAGKCCVHHFAGGWNKMVSRCRPAGKFRSHQSENEAIWKKKEEEKCRRCVGLAASFCLTSTSAAASFRLPVPVIHLGVSSSGFYFSLPPPVVLTFLCSLVLMMSEQEAAGPPASANATPQNWSFIDKSDVAASPRTTTKPLYIQCFLCSQAVQSPFKSFLFNLIVQAFFIFISSCSLGWTLARCGNRHFQMSFRWHFQVWASRLNLGKCSVENWKLFFFFFSNVVFFFFF